MQSQRIATSNGLIDEDAGDHAALSKVDEQQTDLEQTNSKLCTDSDSYISERERNILEKMRSGFEAQAGLTAGIRAEIMAREATESRSRLGKLQYDLDGEENAWKAEDIYNFNKFSHHVRNARMITNCDARFWDIVAWHPTPAPYRKVLHTIISESHYLAKVGREVAHLRGWCSGCPKRAVSVAHLSQCPLSRIDDYIYACANYPQQFGSAPCPYENGPADYRPQGENTVKLQWISAAIQAREVWIQHADVKSFWPHKEWKHSIQAMIIPWLQKARSDLEIKFNTNPCTNTGLVEELHGKVDGLLSALLQYLEVDLTSHADSYISDFITTSAGADIQKHVMGQVSHYRELFERSIHEIAGEYPHEQTGMLLSRTKNDQEKNDDGSKIYETTSKKGVAYTSEGAVELSSFAKYEKTTLTAVFNAPDASQPQGFHDQPQIIAPSNALFRRLSRVYIGMLPSSHYPRAVWTLTNRFGGRMSMIEIIMYLHHHDGDLDRAAASIEHKLEHRIQRQRVQ